MCLGIDCDSHSMSVIVPEKRRGKYTTTLQQLLTKPSVTYSEIEQMVGRLVFLECAVPAGLWYTRYQNANMSNSGVRPDAKKRIKNVTMIYVTQDN